MSLILYNIVISPLEYLIEVLFSFFYQIIEFDIISSIFFISFFVSLFCLPFYCRADKIRKEEDEKYSEIKPYVNKIKTNFKGDEQFFLLQTLYRQNNYNPIMALRNSFSLLLQIPFFIAAYHFFSNLELLNNCSWGIFKDLSKPDGLINAGGICINLLPIIMTLTNIVSCEIYLKGKDIKARIQPYVFAFIFLILLYNSPSALVIYWTFNNFFYLLKNKYMDNNPRIFAYILLCLGVIVACIGNYNQFVDLENNYLNILKIISPFLLAFLIIKFWNLIKKSLIIFKDSPDYLMVFILLFSAIGLILLQSIIIPIGLLNSDLPAFAIQFDNLNNISNIVIENVFTFIGLYLFWGWIVFYFTQKYYRIYYIITFISIYLVSIFNYLNLSKELGTISPDLIFDVSDSVQRCFGNISVQISNIFVSVFFVIIIVYLLKKALFKPIIGIVLTILVTELIVSGIYIHRFVIGINSIYKTKDNINLMEKYSKKIEFSKTGKNVLIIFLDRFAAGFLPMLFEEKPELKKSYSGFVFYPNTVSFYGSTVLGYPPLIGGYEYTPFVLDKDSRSFTDKWLEANLMLPTLFKNNNFSSMVVEPVAYFDNSLSSKKEDTFGSIYTSRGLNYIKMAGRYNAKFHLDKTNDNKGIRQIQKKFYLYSYFCTFPKILKNFVYNEGYYLLARTKGNKENFFAEKTLIESYSSLLYLKDITKIGSDKNTFVLINNDLPHNMHFLQYPNYEYVKDVTNLGPNKFKDDNSFKAYHTAMAAAILTGNYLEYLRKIGVYDNSRIIIVSDHGNRYLNFPHYNEFQNKNITPYNPLLMVKDFNQNFELKTDNTFMTNADTPFIATKDLIDNAKNPFTGKVLTSDEKANGVDVYMNLYYWNPSDYTSSKVIIDKHPVIKHVKGDIFNESNWNKVIY